MAFGLPCNSHSFMTSSVHKRWALMPHGDEGEQLVVNGNAIAYRTTLLIVLALARSIQWAVENPSGSKCLLLPTFNKLIYGTGNLLGSTTCKWWGLQFFEINKSKNWKFATSWFLEAQETN